MEPYEIPAFAVSTELAAKGNTLSFWLLDAKPNEIAVEDETRQEKDSKASNIDPEKARSEAAKVWVRPTALAIAGAREKLDKIDLVWVPLDDISSAGLVTARTEGNTPVEDLRGTHLDVVQLDLHRFCKVASLIGASFDLKNFVRFTSSEVSRMLVEAVRLNRVKLNALQEKLRGEVEAALQKASAPENKKSPPTGDEDS